MVRFSRVRLAACPMCHPQVIRSRQWMRHDGGNTLQYQAHREGLRALPLKAMECENRQQPLSPCTPRADTQPHMLIGWHLGAHAHYHVDTRPTLGAAAWPLDLFAQWVTVIVVSGSGVA